MGHCLFVRKGETHTKPSRGIIASDLAVGSSVYLMEDGVATEYMVVNQGIPSDSSLYDASCNGTWLLRKDIHSNRVWDNDSIDLETSDIHAWLNGDFFNILGSTEQSAIKQVKIPYRSGGSFNGITKSGANGLSCKVFLLSGYELGGSTISSYIPEDGAKLDYFEEGTEDSAMNKRIAYLEGVAKNWWTRTPGTQYESTICEVSSNGNISTVSHVSNSYGIRPAVILPFNSLFDKNTLILKGVT